MTTTIVNKENVLAGMMLSAVGDAMGFKNGSWEFSRSPKQIIKEYNEIGGYEKIEINKREWRLSDDTIMHLATAVAIITPTTDNESIFEELAKNYIGCMDDMSGRSPGMQTINSVQMMTPHMKSKLYKYNEIPYSKSGGGCGGAMRSMCIGFKYVHDDQLEQLIAISIESGRITHNHPVGFLGAMVSALFSSYALRSIPPQEWGYKLMVEVLPLAKKYLESTKNTTNRTMENYETGWVYFWNAWKSYLKTRKIPTTKEEYEKTLKSDYPIFPVDYTDYKVREQFYESISYSGWGGSSGHDSVIIAYDALLGAGDNWEEMIKRAILHGGDNDSTGAIGCCFFGALYGFKGVPECNWKTIEYKSMIINLSNEIIKLIK